MSYTTQQLAPLIRRIHVTGAPCAFPDPALSEWGRAQLSAAAPVDHDDLITATEGCGIHVEALSRDEQGHVRLCIRLHPDERLWGAYDADAVSFDRRGSHVHLVNELHPRGEHLMASDCDLCAAHDTHGEAGLAIGEASNYGELHLPIVLSSRGWGLYVANATHDAVFDLGHRNADALTFDARGGAPEIYVIGPADPLTLISEIARLTGHQPLPPAWTLGFLQSRFGYEGFQHVHDVLDRFARERLPVHGVIFDVQWLEDHVNLRWDPTCFPQPAANLRRIAERGIRSIVITEPGTRVGASNHESGMRRGAFATGADGKEFDSKQWYAQRGIEGYREITPSAGALVNVFREDAADWWYDQHTPLLDHGVDAWWLDLNEPEDVTPDVRFECTDWPARLDVLEGTDARNIFAIAQQRLFARRDRAHTSRRPFALSRSGSVGSQRYGAAPWTGDVGATWSDLRVQPRLMLLAGLCGMPLTGSDVGGFFGDPGPELFTRWMQLGAVSPIFRAHGCMRDREPWSQGDRALAALRPSLLLRAQLLPTIASWAREAIQLGEPLMRPMLLGPLGIAAGSDEAQAYTSDERFHDLDDQWFFGRLLAAPVLEEAATTRRVLLPRGEWVDLWTGEVHTGEREIEVDVELGTLPLFVPRDAVLVVDVAPLAGRGHAWPPAELEAWSWAGDGMAASMMLYLDDGITRLHEQGAYCLQRVVVCDGEVQVQRLGGAWPSSRIRATSPSPGCHRNFA